jgi:hypothetical protein
VDGSPIASEADARSLVGTVVAGKYRRDAVSAESARSAVFRATQLELDRAVALKMLRGFDHEAKARFRRDAQIAATVKHPAIAEVFDFGTDEANVPFFALELLEGETLADRLAREGTIRWPEAVELAARLASALHAVHAKGYLHRNLKPSNVLLSLRADGTREPKVLDFGLARPIVVEHATPAEKTLLGLGRSATLQSLPGTVKGTPGYMSPEQAFGAKLDARTDQFSLAVVLYEMLTGAVPSLAEVLDQGIEPIARRAPDAGVPRAIERVVMRALAKDPADRYGSASELSVALFTALAEVRAGRGDAREGRRKAAAIAVGVVVAASLSIGVLALRAQRSATAPRPVALVPPRPPTSVASLAPPPADSPTVVEAPTTATPARVPPHPTSQPRARAIAPPARTASAAATSYRIDDLKSPFP